SILDFVMNQTDDLQRKLNSSDSQRLDKYLTQLREMEQELQTNPTACPDQPPKEGYEGSPEYQEHWRRMTRLTVLALKCDLTRVITMMYNNGTGDPYANAHGVAHGSVSRGGSFI